MSDFTLGDLERIISERAVVDDGSSYTHSLLNRGIAKCSQKLGEEAVECVIAAMQDDREELKNEAADLLYHLLVVLKARDISVADIFSVLAQRTGQSGLDEKASRKDY